MQKSKIGKFSIFSFLDVKLKFLMSWVELTQFSVESSRVKLKIWATRLESSWKCEQLDSILIRVQNVNLKLNLMISLREINIWSTMIIKTRSFNKRNAHTSNHKCMSWVKHSNWYDALQNELESKVSYLKNFLSFCHWSEATLIIWQRRSRKKSRYCKKSSFSHLLKWMSTTSQSHSYL